MSIKNNPANQYTCNDDRALKDNSPAVADNMAGHVLRAVELTPAVSYCTSEQMDLLRQIVSEIDHLASRKAPRCRASFATRSVDAPLQVDSRRDCVAVGKRKARL
jgi:hypothetical protein